jgi:hypothetical protein
MMPETGSSNPAMLDAPDTATLRATSRDERGINTVSMSTSEFVGTLDSGTLHVSPNGRIFPRNGALRKLSGGVVGCFM